MQSMHRTHLAMLFAAVAPYVSGTALSPTSVGRRFGGTTALRHKIKRTDRLLLHRHRHREARSLHQAPCRVTLARLRGPLIRGDCSDLKADQSLHLLRASLTVGGRSSTLYEEVHPQQKLNNAAVPRRLLQRSPTLLPAGVAPFIVTYTGFQNPLSSRSASAGVA
jgi:hypothetical protein